MVQKQEVADGGARAPDIPEAGQSRDTPATSAGKRPSDDMPRATKRPKRATEACASPHTASSAMPADAADEPTTPTVGGTRSKLCRKPCRHPCQQPR